MNGPFTTDAAQKILRVREFFLARQPILDRQQQLFAYELLIPTLKKLRLTSDALFELEVAAFEWSNNVSRSAVDLAVI